MTSPERPTPILTPPVPIEDFDLFLGVIGQWNLYDFDLRALRYSIPNEGSAALELDLCLHADSVRRRAPDQPVTEYEVGFRFSGVEGVEALALGPQNMVVVEYEFTGQEEAADRQSGIYVELDFISGELRFLCQSIAVTHVCEHLILA